MNLEEFMESSPTNYWIEEASMEIYVRKGFHYIEHKLMNTLDIANVTVAESQRGKGVFTAFLARAEEQAKLYHLGAVYVESLQNQRLYRMLLRNGYLNAPNSGTVSPSVYKPIT